MALRTTHLTLAAAPTTVRPGGPVTLTAALKTNAFKPLAGGKVLICGKPAVGWTACWYVTTGADGIARSVVRPASTTTYLAATSVASPWTPASACPSPWRCADSWGCRIRSSWPPRPAATAAWCPAVFNIVVARLPGQGLDSPR